LEVKADAVISAHHLREKVGGVDRLEFTIDIDLLSSAIPSEMTS
jgi:hypothetical protein